MKLAANEPRMCLQLDHFDERAIRRKPAQVEAMLDERIAVLVIDFVAMAMSLTHLRNSVDLPCQRPRAQSAWIGAQSHGAAHVGHVLLIFH